MLVVQIVHNVVLATVVKARTSIMYKKFRLGCTKCH